MKTLTKKIKLESDFLPKLKIWELKKQGYLDKSKKGKIEWQTSSIANKNAIGIESHPEAYHPYIRLSYTQTDPDGEKENFDYKIELTRTPCNYGGYRYWFLCPLARKGMMCGRRSGVLYKAGDYFGCRHCYNLTYWCRQHNKDYSLNWWFKSRKALNKIRKLETEIKRNEYNGKLTKKRKRLNKIYYQALRDLSKFDLPT